MPRILNNTEVTLPIALKQSEETGRIKNFEIGLVKLCRVTGEKRYLDLARFFLDVRGPGGWEYNQAHKKVVDQR